MIELRPLYLSRAKTWVKLHHRHNDGEVRALWSVGAYVDGEMVGCVVVGRPVAPTLQVAGALEVTRNCTEGYPNAASRLLGAAWGAAKAMGCRRMVSYTRIDEAGTSYRAAGWVPVAIVDGTRDWNTGNKAMRWLPGISAKTTDAVMRVRWEIGPDAAMTRINIPKEMNR